MPAHERSDLLLAWSFVLVWGSGYLASKRDWRLLAAVAFLVVFASILAVIALHTLMRRGQATRVTSLFFLTPIVAVLLEWAMFQVIPTWLTVVGIVITCTGVAFVEPGNRPRFLSLAKSI